VLIGLELDLGRSDLRHVHQAISQLLRELALDEPLAEGCEQHRDQYADREERDRRFSSTPHPSAR
jgi:hypothetical protein